MVQCSWKWNWRVLLLTILIAIAAVFWRIMFTELIDLAEICKCPVCYGTSLCAELFNHSIKLDDEYLLRNTINMLNSKRVLFGTLNGHKIVIKNLASDTNFENIRNIYVNTLSGGSVLDIITSIEDFLHLPYYGNTVENIKLCPSTENLMTLLHLVIENNKNEDMQSLYSHIWTSFRSNIEPLIQQVTAIILIAQSCELATHAAATPNPTPAVAKVLHGWPVTNYYGSCGRLVVSEYCGISLTEYSVTADWKCRSSIARQLLEAALNFTFSHSHFAFYFTDISADNIAVSDYGTAKFIDLEHVIIVDKNSKDHPQFWDEIHQSENFGLEDAFIFSTNDICNHRISDHNVYSVCREILWKKSPLLSGGLLYNPPLPLQQQLEDLLDSCVSPSAGLSRFHVASKLIALLV